MTSRISAQPCNTTGEGPAAIPRLVDRLHGLADRDAPVTFGELTETIGAQGHAPLLMIAATMMILPIGMIPGVGGALGALVAIIGLHMLLGRREVWLPGMLGRREVSAARIRDLVRRARPVSEWLHRHMRIRWEALSGSPTSVSLIACILIVTGGSLMVLGAIPVAAPMLGVPVAFFAFGLLARDGVVIALGYGLVIAVLALLVTMSGG